MNTLNLHAILTIFISTFSASSSVLAAQNNDQPDISPADTAAFLQERLTTYGPIESTYWITSSWYRVSKGAEPDRSRSGVLHKHQKVSVNPLDFKITIERDVETSVKVYSDRVPKEYASKDEHIIFTIPLSEAHAELMKDENNGYDYWGNYNQNGVEPPERNIVIKFGQRVGTARIANRRTSPNRDMTRTIRVAKSIVAGAASVILTT